RLWGADQSRNLDAAHGRWIGSLLAGIGESVSSVDSGPLATFALIREVPVSGFWRFGQGERYPLPPLRTAGILALACAFAEVADPSEIRERSSALPDDVLAEALRARETGEWPDGGYYDAIEDSGFKRRLAEWAAGNDTFISVPDAVM
ncbi:hypothetical protein HER21_33355, partial [Pseudomonas sp. BGM005]|nr:hypothetical protein [Pseudomonas sp. BG5]